jgi:hypothetical protein
MRKDQSHEITLHFDDTRDLFADRRDIRMYHLLRLISPSGQRPRLVKCGIPRGEGNNL